jgi:catechol 2,3-dioxygenase-like lactoylglutathione lyase family enzyme
MSQRARIGFKVHDLTASIAFYERLGFSLLDTQIGADIAYMAIRSGVVVLLAGPSVEDMRALLDEPRIAFKPGDVIDFPVDNLDATHKDLIEKGFTEVQEDTDTQGSRRLILHAPSGYTIVFKARITRSPEEIIALYEQGPDEVAKLVAGLTAAELDLARSPGEWSIRQIVHHLAESDSIFLMVFKTALAQSGSTFIRSPYDQEHWATLLGYNERAIETSLALSRAVRTHITQLLRYVPNNWDNYVLLKFASEEGEGHKTTVGGLLGTLGRHVEEHCEEIRETRRRHGLS